MNIKENHENRKKQKIEFQKRITNQENLRIPCQIRENHENLRIQIENHENYENLIIPQKNYEKHQNHNSMQELRKL